MLPNVEPLEKTDPDLAFEFMEIAQGRASVIISNGEVYYKAKQRGQVLFKKFKRNDPCPCGSGKKYKKCCLNLEA